MSKLMQCILRKIRKYLNYTAAVQIYKQLILPILDYSGFLLIACNTDRKKSLQLVQNDALRFCDNNRRNDRIPLEIMHKKANLSSLEQHRCVQLLQLLYKRSKREGTRKVGARNTRQNDKFVFKTDNRVGTKYSHSPLYKGTKLWDSLEKDVQFSESINLFKQSTRLLYKVYVKDFYV